MSGAGAQGQAYPAGSSHPGQAGYFTGVGSFNALSFLVRQIIAGKTFGALVEVIKVHASTVDVKPCVNQVDGSGQPVPHGVISGMPYFQLQGGASGIKLAPAVGDIGACLICDRDISNVKSTGAAANPGSSAQNSWSDGLYFGRFIGPAPTEFIEFTGSGINIQTSGVLNITATDVKNDNVSIGHLHTHTGVTTGAGTSGPPST